MTFTKSFTKYVTADNADDLSFFIDSAVKHGDAITVNGHTPVAAWGNNPSHVWTNGTLSIKVKAKAKGKFNDIYFKVGSTVTVVHTY